MSDLKLNLSEKNHLISLLKNDLTKKSYLLAKKIEKSKNRITVASAKSKGRNLQYWVCEKLADLFGIEFNQSDDDCPIHSREMGLHGTDVILRGNIKDIFKYDIECKAQESFNLVESINQAKDNTSNGRDWLVILKKKSIGDPIVIMDYDAFERLFKKSVDYVKNFSF